MKPPRKTLSFRKRLYRLVVAYEKIAERAEWDGSEREFKRAVAVEIADMLVSKLPKS
jgi:hypothetical protein